MKVLLIGPQPPPHGGISVHVEGIRRHLVESGVTCRVLNMCQVRRGLRFAATILAYAVRGWTLHFHTNGHNIKSWLLALGSGLGGQFRGGAILTLHSGMVPGYLEAASPARRKLAVFTCSLYRQVICVSSEIEKAVASLGVDSRRMEVLPAFLSADSSEVATEAKLGEWMGRHRPLFSTVLFFRPEYGFDLLMDALARLRAAFPALGCVVMGSGEQRAEAVQKIREARLEENVLLIGDVDHDACLALMSKCDAFLRPTLEDGDSISVREALALGVPVVASRVGARPADAILFRAGDVNDLVAKIELALGEQRAAGTRTAGSLDRLMEIYREVNGSEGRLCLN